MLTVNLYQTIEKFCLQQTQAKDDALYICPGPLIADEVRALFGNNTEIITIAKWIGDQLKKNNQKRVMKSELLLRLSSVWRHYFPNGNEQIFYRAFDIFTDLRSFTLEKDLLHEVLSELDADLKKSVLLFWVYLETEGLIDEQLAYKLVSEDRSIRPLHFVGFKHMNAIQIDMLKSLAEFKSITVAFPKEVYCATLPNDWIRWLLPESADCEVSNIAEDDAAQIVIFPKNKLNIYLKEFRNNNTSFEIVIPATKIDVNHLQEVLSSDSFFKTPVDIFTNAREKIFAEINRPDFNISLISSWLDQYKKQMINDQNFAAYKLCTMIEESLVVLAELAPVVDSFFISVINQVVILNSPRNFMVSLNENHRNNIIGPEELRFKKSIAKTVVIASGVYGALLSPEKPYNEKILGALLTLGPFKRHGLDFLFIKDIFKTLFKNPETTLFLEEGLKDNDLAWREILKNMNMRNYNLEVEHNLKAKRDVIKEKTQFIGQPVSTVSASKLQLYLDCPRKYYFSYIEKLNLRPQARLTIESDEKGNIEHKVIGDYLKLYREYDFQKHFDFCKREFNQFLAHGHVVLSKQDSESTLYELLEYTKNGIQYLLNYQERYPGSNYDFEVSFDEPQIALKGYVDAVLKYGNEIHIFDFKRSQASIGTKKELLSFEKIQLWLYRWALMKNNKVVSLAYINLSDGKDLVLSEDEINKDSDFSLFLEHLLNRYKNENEFAPHPRSENICRYCDLSLLCPKEKLG